MTDAEIGLILSKRNAAIVAPAGHGKTEMITELVAAMDGKTLVLTHTNAGVDALRKRLKKNCVQPSRYMLCTISSFCILWTEAYPCSSGIDLKLDVTSNEYHGDRARGALTLFAKDWAKGVLASTYSAVVVDEYQDCLITQHEIFLELNNALPVYVFGDPLQAIFGWAGKLAPWEDLGFERVEVRTYPWRWEHTNKELGEYLTEIREKIMPVLSGQEVSLKIPEGKQFVKRIPNDLKPADIINMLKGYESVLYLSVSQREQAEISRKSGGRIQNDEKQDLDELFEYAGCFDDEDNRKKAEGLIGFIEKCATHVSKELGSYKRQIDSGKFDFSRIKKHPEFRGSMDKVLEQGMLDDVLSALEYVNHCGAFKIFRRELYSEMIRSIRIAKERDMSVSDAGRIIRTNPAYRRSYSKFRMISSRTVLSKGLEFECVVVIAGKKFSGTDMYVAMTRATKMIYVISGSSTITLSVPKGSSFRRTQNHS